MSTEHGPQRRIALRRIALVGAGALGSALALQIFAGGLGWDAEVLVVDPDRLERQNLALSRLYQAIFAEQGPSVLGHFKVELMAREMQRRGAGTWTGYALEIADLGWQCLRNCDLLVSCPDSTLARIETALVATSLKIPMLDGGVFRNGTDGPVEGGRVAWFPPAVSQNDAAACYLCGVGELRRAELLAYATSSSLGCRLPDEHAAVGADEARGRICASLEQTAERMMHAMRAYFDGDRSAGAGAPETIAWAERLRGGEAGMWSVERVHLSRSLTCPWHDPTETTLLSLEDDRPICEAWVGAQLGAQTGARRDSGAWRMELTWPICLAARCRICGHRQAMAQRLPPVRRCGVCEKCASIARLEPLCCVSSLGRNDALAKRTPRQLGQPVAHMLPLRPSFFPARPGRGNR